MAIFYCMPKDASGESSSGADRVGGMSWYSELRQKMADKEVRWLLERDAPLWIYRIYGKYAATPLVDALDDSVYRVRGPPAGVLVKIGGDAVPALVHALKNKNIEVRQTAAWVLERIAENNPGSDKVIAAVPALIEALGDEDSEVRSSATQALVRIEIPAMPAVIEALKNDKGEAYAALVLERIAEKAEIDLRAVGKALKEVVDSVKEEGNSAATRHAKSRALFRYMNICKAARSHSAKKHALAGDGVILEGERPKPPSGRDGTYRAACGARAVL